MAPHSSTLAWKIPWTEEPARLQSMGSLRVGHDWATSLSLFTSCIGEGNGNPLQCSCLENPRDGGAWWAAIYGVAQSWTRLKWLSSISTTLGFPGGSEVKASAWNARDPGSIPGLGRSPGEGNSAPLQYSCLENPMDGGVWWAAAHRVTKSQTQLSGFTFFLSVPHWWTWSTTKIDHLRPKRQKIFYQWSSFFFWNKCILLFFSRFVEICDTQHCISLGCTALFDLHVLWNDYQS